MQFFTSALAVAGLVASVSALGQEKRWDNGTVYTTEVVTAYTTYCPLPTSIVHGNKTYTVTEATTLTITDCPCTLTSAVPTTPATSGVAAPTTYAPAPPATTSAVAPTTTKPAVVTAGAAFLAPGVGALVAGGLMAVLL